MRLFFVWYCLVVVLLVSLLFELLFRPVFSLLFFLRLFLVCAALIGSSFVFGEYQRKHATHKHHYSKMRDGLLAELQKKNAEIKRLNEERQMFLNTAVKQAAKTLEVSSIPHSIYHPLKNRKP